MAKIKASTEVLNSTASEIRTLNNTMTSKLEAIQKEVNNLVNVSYISDAATKALEKMNTYKKPIDDYKANVEKYADFLVRAAQNIESTEITIEQNTSGLEFH